MLRETDKDLFRSWLLPRLDAISDADPEVLVDYVLALVNTDSPEGTVRRQCVEALSDFLHDDTESFVDDILSAIAKRSYLSKAKSRRRINTNPEPAPIPSIVDSPTSPSQPRNRAKNLSAFSNRSFDKVSGISNASHPPPRSSRTDQSEHTRKRKYGDVEDSNNHPTRDTSYKRPSKRLARRSEKNGEMPRAQSVNNGVTALGASPSSLPTMTEFHGLPNIPPFDPANPLNSMLLLSMFHAFAMGISPVLPTVNDQSRMGRCADYDSKGYCPGGNMCPFEHGSQVFTKVANGTNYEPNHPSRKSKPGGKPRASFSAHGPCYDLTQTALVVEQIPDEYCSEDYVQDYFSKFGRIVETHIQAHRHLAIVAYEDHASANRAYLSSEAVFNNRFVRVFWYKQDTLVHGSEGNGDTNNFPWHLSNNEIIDLETIRKRQDEAQKLFEERRKKAAEVNAKSKKVKRQLRKKLEETRKLRVELALKTGEEPALRDLDAEAQALLAQNDEGDVYSINNGNVLKGRGRGGFLYRRQYPTTPAGYNTSQGKVFRRGRGHKFSGVLRLDNRPKRIAISGIEAESSQDELVRQHLFNSIGCISVEQHTDKPNTLVAVFKERYMAEIFIDEAYSIPGLSKLDLSWVPHGVSVIEPPTQDAQASRSRSPPVSSDVDSENFIGFPDRGFSPIPEDLDVAENDHYLR